MTGPNPSEHDAPKTAAQTPEDLNPMAVEVLEDEEGGLWDEMEDTDAGKSPPGEEDRDREEFEASSNLDQQEGRAPDPWASAPEEIRREREELLAKTQKAEDRIKSDAGRVAANQRRIAELQKMLQTPATVISDVDPAETLKPFAEDYPEVAGPVTEAMNLLKGQINTLSEAETNRRAAAEQELVDLVSAEEAAVEAAHPGWYDLLEKNGPAFMGWIDDQPRAVREGFIRNMEKITDSSAAISVIEAFKSHLNPQPPEAASQQQPPNTRRERQLAGSSSPSGGSRAPVRSGIPDTADEQAIWDAMEEMEQAQQRR